MYNSNRIGFVILHWQKEQNGGCWTKKNKHVYKLIYLSRMNKWPIFSHHGKNIFSLEFFLPRFCHETIFSQIYYTISRRRNWWCIWTMTHGRICAWLSNASVMFPHRPITWSNYLIRNVSLDFYRICDDNHTQFNVWVLVLSCPLSLSVLLFVTYSLR